MMACFVFGVDQDETADEIKEAAKPSEEQK